VVVLDSKIIGFADVDCKGYFDHLFVHKDHQRRGVATLLAEEIESWYNNDILVHASRSAKGFFAKRGYTLLREESVELRGEELWYSVMELRREK